MKKTVLALSLLISQFSIASGGVNTVQALHNSAPGLNYTGIAIGNGQIDGKGSHHCTLLYKNEGSKVKLTLIVKNKFAEIDLDAQLVPYENGENDSSLTAAYNPALGQFSYNYDYGHMTNQITGANSYALKFEKKSEKSFSVSYYYGWADDDGYTGEDNYSCLLTTEK